MIVEQLKPMESSLSNGAHAAFVHAVERSDRFSVALPGVRITTAPGARVRAKVAAALSDFPALSIHGMYSTSGWLGVSTRASLVLVAGMTDVVRTELLTQFPPFRRLWGWEDVALFNGRAVLAWTCTHEREGLIYGTEVELRSLGLDPSVARPIRIGGARLEEDAESAIVGRVGAHTLLL